MLDAARRWKNRTYLELIGPRGRACLVVLAGDVGGGWSEETRSFLTQLANGKSRQEPPILRGRTEQAWRMRWQSILSCAAAKAFAAPLLELRGRFGADGLTSQTHRVVENTFCFVGLGEHDRNFDFFDVCFF